MAGGPNFLDEINRRLGAHGINTGSSPIAHQLLGDYFGAPEAPPPPIRFFDEQIDPSQLTPEQVAELTGSKLPEAEPQDGTGFSAFDALFDVIDMPGAFVRGLIGAGIEGAKGKFKEAGLSFLGGIPGSEALPWAINQITGAKGDDKVPELRAPTGEELLNKLGMPKGSTAEDERRVRIAKAAGVSEAEARFKFGKAGEKLDIDAQREFDQIMRTAMDNGLTEDDAGITWTDAKNAADLGDVAGIGVDIATDPLTYLSFGASGVGKAAKALAVAEKSFPGIKRAVTAANSLEDALKAVKAAKLPVAAEERLAKQLGKAWRNGKPALELGETLGKRAELGQTAFLNTPGGTPLIKGEAAFKWLSTIGETDTFRAMGRGAGEGNTLTEKLRTFFQGGRKLVSNKSGVGELDDLLGARSVKALEGVTEANRAVDVQSQAMRTLAKAKGVDPLELNRIVTKAAELRKLSDEGSTVSKPEVGKALADLSADMLKAGVTQEDIAPIVAGISKINDDIAPALKAAGVQFQELDDEMLAYLKRHVTPEGRKFLGAKSESSLLQQRGKDWRGKTIPEINKYMRDKHGVGTFFHEDPAFTTKRAVRQAHRAIANAVFGEGVIKQFGEEVSGDALLGRKTASDLYGMLGIRAPEGKALEKLKNTAIPDEIYEFVERATAMQKNPGKMLKAWRDATNWMKATVTTLFPAFHGRNMLEGFAKSTMEGNVDPRNLKDAVKFIAGATNPNSGGAGKIDDAIRAMKRGFSKAGGISPELQKLFSENKMGDNLEKVLDWMTANGVLQDKLTGELGIDLAEAAGGAPAGVLGKAAGAAGQLLGTKGVPVRAGMALASRSDNMFRVSMLIDRLRKGYLPAEAVADVKRIFFDYRNLTQFESSYARNFGFFYNFYRNNLRYITQHALEHPSMNKQIMELFRDDPDNPRFRFLSQAGALKLGAADVALGFLPQGQLGAFDLAEGDVFDKLRGKLGQGIGMLNPAIAGGLNAAYGKDLFSNTPLEYKTRIADLSAAPKMFQDLVGFERTAKGEYKVGWKTNFMLATVPALGRLMQSMLAWDAKDKDYIQKLSRVFTGVGVTYKDATELRKRDLELIDRNIEREAKGLRNLREVGKATYEVDTSTREGRLMSALANPSSEKVEDLFLDPEIGAKLSAYVTFKDGKPVMNRLLHDAINEAFREKYPMHAALFAAQKMRRALRIKRKDEVDLEADEVFSTLFGEQ